VNYQDYLQTEHWQQTRERALDRAEHHCQICHCIERLEVHHNTYTNLGHERDADLVVLCDRCHELFHDSKKVDADFARWDMQLQDELDRGVPYVEAILNVLRRQE
jgi:5-methylcytosine-specific restriction endonuclease McrA